MSRVLSWESVRPLLRRSFAQTRPTLSTSMFPLYTSERRRRDASDEGIGYPLPCPGLRATCSCYYLLRVSCNLVTPGLGLQARVTLQSSTELAHVPPSSIFLPLPWINVGAATFIFTQRNNFYPGRISGCTSTSLYTSPQE
jgi:hypothetical protein